MKSILVVEDEKTMRISLQDALMAEGFEVAVAETGREGMDALTSGNFALVITDVRLPDMNGMDILRHIKEETPEILVIVMTAYGSIEDAVDAMKNEAFDYVTKPFSLDELILTVRRALEVQELAAENLQLRKEISSCYSSMNIVGESPAMERIFKFIQKVSRSDSNVLILGESGTGKELAATAIHYQSHRKNKPFIKINCAALPENLIESELFGYEKGAFTGAVKQKPGRFELADTGTIFLDEIGDLPLLTQAKILRVIEERTIERLGGTKIIEIDVRLIAATHVDLDKSVKRGQFREDLYYRLNVIPVSLPPLRKRKEDIPLLVDLFRCRFNDQLGTSHSFSRQAVEALTNYRFPGNVRELRNIVERCLSLAEGKVIQKEELPAHILKEKGHAALVPLAEVSAEAEKAHILKILQITKGNRTRSAEILGISRKTLWDKITTYKLDV